MYSLILKGEEAKAFKAEVKAKLQEKNISIEDLAKTTGYSEGTLQKFFYSENWNRFLACSIAEELGIEFKLLKKVGEKSDGKGISSTGG